MSLINLSLLSCDTTSNVSSHKVSPRSIILCSIISTLVFFSDICNCGQSNEFKDGSTGGRAIMHSMNQLAVLTLALEMLCHNFSASLFFPSNRYLQFQIAFLILTFIINFDCNIISITIHILAEFSILS